MDTLSEHVFLLQNDVRDICKPLFSYSDICNFSYARIYNQNKIALLTSYPDIYPHIFKRKLVITYEKLKQMMVVNRRVNNIKQSFYYLSKECGSQNNELLREYKMENSIVFVFHTRFFFECFIFSSPRGKNIIQSHFNNADILVQFKYYFAEHAKKLIEDAESHLMPIPYNNKTQENSNMPLDRKKLREFLTVKHYTLNHNGREIRITLREFECLKFLAQGRSAKEVARILNISPRSVESYHRRLMQKLEIHTSSGLIDFYLATDLIALP